MATEPSILQRQNDPAMQALLRAMSVSHRRAQRIAAIRTALSALVAASGLAAAFLKVATPITAIGALWAVIYSVGLMSWADGELRRAAVLQEMFDVRLYGIPWNAVIAGEQVGVEEINRLSKRYAGREDMVRDYYEVPELPHPYDVIGSQEMNLGWGSRVRMRYAYTILAGVVAWSAAGLLAGVLADLTVGQLLLRWYVPSLGIFLLSIDIFRSLRAVAVERDRTLRIVRERVAAAVASPHVPQTVAELRQLARQVQDVLFLTRLRTPRVPDWFFLRFRGSDRADFQAAMEELQAASAEAARAAA